MSLLAPGYGGEYGPGHAQAAGRPYAFLAFLCDEAAAALGERKNARLGHGVDPCHARGSA